VATSSPAACSTTLTEVTDQPAPEPPRLHGNLAEVYRTTVVRLREALAGEDGTEAREAVRALIARVEVHPPAGDGTKPRVELVGEIAEFLRPCGVEPSHVLGPRHTQNPPAGAGGLDIILCSAKGDAGTRIAIASHMACRCRPCFAKEQRGVWRIPRSGTLCDQAACRTV